MTLPSSMKIPSASAAEYQNRGYFKVIVDRAEDARFTTPGTRERTFRFCRVAREKPSTSPCPSRKATATRWAGITFKNNKAVSNVKALRNLFPIKDGDIFSKDKIGKGLENLRKAYGE